MKRVLISLIVLLLFAAPVCASTYVTTYTGDVGLTATVNTSDATYDVITITYTKAPVDATNKLMSLTGTWTATGGP